MNMGQKQKSKLHEAGNHQAEPTDAKPKLKRRGVSSRRTTNGLRD
jgi:hypothetical protein